MKAVIYARYSTDKQNESSIEDQFRVCRELAVKNGYTVEKTYSDSAISGADMRRPGIQAMSHDIEGIDVIICEALDRLSRDMADISLFYKTCEYYRVKIFTISEGIIDEIHIGLKGTMNSLFIKELSAKTRRGLRGRVELGKSGGGNSFGYDVVNKFNVNGDATRGERAVNDRQKQIIKRIFNEYAKQNRSARTIALQLNKESIPSPSCGEWSPSTISGNRRRGTGILNNELYIGQLVWNRLKYTKNPSTGKRVSTLNPESEWILKDVPRLRIIEDDLWNLTKKKQRKLSLSNGAKPTMRPKYLLSELIKCKACGGGFSMINKTRYGCSRARNKGTCSNRGSINKELLEQSVIDVFKQKLVVDDVIEVFVTEYKRHMVELRKHELTSSKQSEKRVEELERQKFNFLKSIQDGIPYEVIKNELTKVLNELEDEKSIISAFRKPSVFSPDLVSRYKQFIVSLSAGGLESEAIAFMRDFITKIEVHGEVGSITADLYVNYMGLVPETNRPSQMTGSNRMVAGAGFEPTTFGL